jgi:hypothetical protein
MPRLEILGSLAVLAASMLLGLVLIYFFAIVHRSEERSSMVDFAARFGEGGDASHSTVSHPFLEGASDVIVVAVIVWRRAKPACSSCLTRSINCTLSST